VGLRDAVGKAFTLTNVEKFFATAVPVDAQVDYFNASVTIDHFSCLA
jgi:hypothetical protein